jgi:hypothetical protein
MNEFEPSLSRGGDMAGFPRAAIELGIEKTDNDTLWRGALTAENVGKLSKLKGVSLFPAGGRRLGNAHLWA